MPVGPVALENELKAKLLSVNKNLPKGHIKSAKRCWAGKFYITELQEVDLTVADALKVGTDNVKVIPKGASAKMCDELEHTWRGMSTLFN